LPWWRIDLQFLRPDEKPRHQSAAPRNGMIRVASKEHRAPRLEHSIEIDVPVRHAYSQWTRFDWRREITGAEIDWNSAIVETETDQRIAWRINSRLRATVDFRPLGSHRTGVALRIDRVPESLLGRLVRSFRILPPAAERELRRFKRKIESVHHRLVRSEMRRRELERFRSLIGVR
jgi:uncharacterized membrane protein